MPDQRPPNKLGNAEASLAVGSVFGDTYRVLSFIGQGGMGFVYKVEHLMMNKIMALKILRSEQVSDDVWRRFKTEAQAIARLDHINVVRIYDMSQTKEGKPFYTMDLLVGQSLADYLEEGGRMPVKEALPVFRQICSGLAYAHDRGIIHRDIKPANIMLIAESNAALPPLVKIVDFGIAKLTARDGSAGQSLTRPGEVFGSPLYMSPEQCSGLPLDYRTDMYSVGVTMFQVLTGLPPLVGKSAIETTAMHLNEIPPSMSEQVENCEFSPRLEEIVARLLEKLPEHRFDSLADVARELMDLERGTGLGRDDGVVAKNTYGEKKISLIKQNSDTTGYTTILPVDKMVARNILISCLVFLAVVGVGAYFWSTLAGRSSHVVELPVTETSPTASARPVTSLMLDQIGSDATIHEPLNQDDLGPEAKRQIEQFLQKKHTPYGHVENRKGRRFTVFEFPREFSLGLYVINPQYGVKSASKLAQGRVIVPYGLPFKLEIGDSVRAYPDLLRYFAPDDLQWIVVGQVPAITPALKANLARFSDLRVLDMMNSPLQDRDLIWVDKFTHLRTLGVSATKVTAAALAKLKVLPKLRSLQIQNIFNPLPVLKVLAASGELYELDVSHTGAGSAEVDQIVKMHKLIRLSFKNDNLVDGDVAKLVSLSHLIDLDIQTNRRLTPKIAETLKKFKQLETLTLPFDLFDEETDKKLMQALPNLHTSESRNGL